MKRGAPPPRKRPADPARDRRLKAKRATHAALDKLQGREAPAPRKGRKFPGVDPGVRLQLGAQGVTLQGQAVTVRDLPPVGVLVKAHAGPRAPTKLHLWDGPAQPKPLRVVAPTWLQLVRTMPCSAPGCSTPAPSEANHHPGRGASGGGSDLEVHPVCRECHAAITEHRPLRDGKVATHQLLDLLVQRTLLQGVRAVRSGRVQAGIMLAAGVEILIGGGT